MKCFVVLLVVCGCWCAPAPEESVVSVYTTLASSHAAGTDVYSQIATNIAERITQPLYRFFGFNESSTTTKRPFEHIEIANTTRDIEELDEERRKPEKKPEKITLYTNYLPINDKNGKLELNDTIKSNEIDDFDDDFDVEDEKDQESPRGPFIYFLELAGSILQLLWGGFLALFRPSSNNE